ncbi:hypothetical protein M436DRAFT_61001 [Aureobasidium namibiae CBS 147.97]|uniref:Uncharacterized protein n=1 Tax=Aureobasidium namibiae CBS 147.97 TaxID=1043004 RepID=A0A074WVN8_9PEZI
MGISSSKSSTITVRPSAADAAPAAAEEAAGEIEEEKVTVIILGPRWVRDKNTGQQYVEKNRRRDDMLERRGEVTHVLREQGKRFFTRHKDGTMQMDPRRAPIGTFDLQHLMQSSSISDEQSHRYKTRPSQAVRESRPSLGIEELWNLTSANIQVLDDHLLSAHPTFSTPPDRQQPWVRMAVSKNTDDSFQAMLLERGILFAETKCCQSPYEAVLEMFEHTGTLVAKVLAGDVRALRTGGQKEDETVMRLDLMRRKPGESFETACEQWTDEKGRRRSSAQELEKDVMRGV